MSGCQSHFPALVDAPSVPLCFATVYDQPGFNRSLRFAREDERGRVVQPTARTRMGPS